VTGADRSFIVCEDASLFSFGDNQCGELGTGDSTNRLTPTRVDGLGPVRQVAVSNFHTGIVTDDGNLFMCGNGDHGRLGLGNMEDQGFERRERFNLATPTLVPRAVFDGEAVLMVACGNVHTAVVTEGGNVYTFGCDISGACGHKESRICHMVPKRVPAAGFHGERIVMVAAAASHTVALSDAGHVFTCGRNLYGQLGHGDQSKQSAFVQVDPMQFNGEVVEFVATGVSHHTVAITAGGRLYTWGHGGSGQLGHGDTDFRLVPTLVEAGEFVGLRVTMAACGALHTLIVTQDGSLWACGRGNNGRLGLNTINGQSVFVRVEIDTKIVAVAAGLHHSLAVAEDGTLWTWGNGRYGDLGHGNQRECRVPTRLTVSPLDTLRVGRFHLLPQEDAIAFAMSQNRRLGASSRARALNTDMLKMIQDNSHNMHNLDFAKHRSLITLLGGRNLLPSRVCRSCVIDS